MMEKNILENVQHSASDISTVCIKKEPVFYDPNIYNVIDKEGATSVVNVVIKEELILEQEDPLRDEVIYIGAKAMTVLKIVLV